MSLAADLIRLHPDRAWGLATKRWLTDLLQLSVDGRQIAEEAFHDTDTTELLAQIDGATQHISAALALVEQMTDGDSK